MMEERYHATTQNRFYPDMSNVNKNITVEAKLSSPPTYILNNALLNFSQNKYFQTKVIEKIKTSFLSSITFFIEIVIFMR